MQDLIASYLAHEREAGTELRTVRDFCGEFSGLTSTVKRKPVVAAAGLERAHLKDLLGADGRFDRSALERLLHAMREASKTIPPKRLGELGEDHFRQRLLRGGQNQSFRYKQVKGELRGLPYLVEAAFVVTEDPVLRGQHFGLN